MREFKIILIVLFCLNWGICFGEDTYKPKHNPWTEEKDWVTDTKDASDIVSDTSDFNSILSSTDDTVQKALDVLDDAVATGGAAPINADYLVGTANDVLSAEIVVGTTPGGDLGNTWAAPSVDDDSHNHVYSNIDETTSSNWIGRVSDETGTGKWVFGTAPTFTTSIIVNGTASPTIVDTQLLENSSGGDLTIRDGIDIQGDLDVEGDATITGTASASIVNISNYLDIGIGAAPANPDAGLIRIYGDSADNDLKARNSSGDVVVIGDFP